MSKPSYGGDLIKKLCETYASTSSRSIAKMAYAQAPSLFKDVEDARQCVRYYRGSHGAKDRQHKKFETPKIPQAKKRLKNWGPLAIPECNALVMNDLHIPYHERTPIRLAVESGRNARVDTVILNGDILDCHAVSFWETDPRERRFAEEIRTLIQFFCYLRDKFPKQRIIYKLGNHEERWERYMWVKAPELLGVKQFELKSLFELERFGIELVEDKRPIQVGNLNIIHGHEYKQPFTNPVNPARGLFLKAKAYSMCGHYHQSSYHTDKTITEQVIATWSVGCLCDLHAWYMPLNNWTHGFALVKSDKRGRFNVTNRVVRGNKIY